MPLDEILADIQAQGWLISNAYQYDNGLWRANLRTSPDADSLAYRASAFAEAPTLELALLMCIDKMESAPTYQSIPISSSPNTDYDADTGADKRPSLASLLTNLRPTSSIPRRL